MIQETCWTLIHAAGRGDAAARNDFTNRYLPAVRAYLVARWSGTPLSGDVDDTVQDVFIECFRAGGALQRATPGVGEGFRAFLFGVVRNVALHAERSRLRRHHHAGEQAEFDEIAGREESCATAFDRAWARAVMREAAELQVAHAKRKGAAAQQRAEILRLRFQENLPIRAIAQRWATDPARLHHEYALARREFAAALREVVGDHHTGSPAALEQECGRLLELLR